MSNESVEKQNGGSPFNGMMEIENIEDIWMTQKEMAQLFGRDVRTINDHVETVKSELAEWEGLNSTIRKERRVQIEGCREINREIETYNFDFICQVGYKISGLVGMRFRQYATQAIKEKIVRDCNLKNTALEKKNMTLEKANETYKALIIEYFNRWQDEKYNREQDEKLFHLQEAKEKWGTVSETTGKERVQVRAPSLVSNRGRNIPMPSPYVQPDVIDCATMYGQLSDIETLQLTEGEA